MRTYSLSLSSNSPKTKSKKKKKKIDHVPRDDLFRDKIKLAHVMLYYLNDNNLVRDSILEHAHSWNKPSTIIITIILLLVLIWPHMSLDYELVSLYDKLGLGYLITWLAN